MRPPAEAALADCLLLLEYLRHLAAKPAARKAVRFRPAPPDPTETEDGEEFRLPGGDLLWFFPPAAESHASRRITGPATWYDPAVDLDALCRLVEASIDGPAQLPTTEAPAMPAVEPAPTARTCLTPDLLARLEQTLLQTDLSSLIRCRLICRIADDGSAVPMMSEPTLSLAGLAGAVLPDGDLYGNPALLSRLEETLDRRMLALLCRPERSSTLGDLAVRLTVATIASDAFAAFDARLGIGRRGRIVVVVGLADLIGQMSRAIPLFRILQWRGYRLCIDGINKVSLGLVDWQRLPIDYLKVEAEGIGLDLLAGVGTTGRSVILTGADDRATVRAGQKAGIQLFQGRYVEQWVAEDERRRRLLGRQMRRRNRDGIAGPWPVHPSQPRSLPSNG